jgi:putative transposase
MALDGAAISTRIMTVHRIALDVNKTQDMLFAQCAGIARFSWNWALDRWKSQYAAHRENNSLPKPSEAALRRELNAIKRTDYPWMMQAPKAVPQQAIKNLGAAFKGFFEGRSRYPNFKAKGLCRESFRPDNGPGTFRVEGRRLKLPRIGWVKMREALRFGADINPTLKSVTISPGRGGYRRRSRRHGSGHLERRPQGLWPQSPEAQPEAACAAAEIPHAKTEGRQEQSPLSRPDCEASCTHPQYPSGWAS